jgi:hypothetical protein
MLFNAMLLTTDVADAAPDNADFWEAPPPKEENNEEVGPENR